MYRNILPYSLLLILTLCGMFGYFHFISTDHTTIPPGTSEVRAEVLSVDNSDVSVTSFSSIGTQELEIKILEGEFKGEILTANYSLIGQVDLENNFHRGDKIVAAIITKEGKITHVRAVDLYRQNILLFLLVVFVAALIAYAGTVGVKALISFVMSVFILWEILIKGILAGHSPMLITTCTLMLLSGIIIFLVAGVNRKGVTAFLGTLGGLFISLLVMLIVGERAGLHGLTQPYVTVLIFSGYSTLNVQEILYAAILLGASGAAMDIAMDIAASMEEIFQKNPSIKPLELMQSGFTVGRHVVGTMATTLLLAYSGGYLTLLMVFRIKEPTITRMVNLKIVAAEIVRTLVGSIGLVMVAPLTAIIGAFIITGVITLRHRKSLLMKGKPGRELVVKPAEHL